MSIKCSWLLVTLYVTIGTKQSHNFDYDVSAVHFGDRELSLCNPVLSAVKDLRPSIQLADFPRISVMLPEATGRRDTVSQALLDKLFDIKTHKIKTIPSS